MVNAVLLTSGLSKKGCRGLQGDELLRDMVRRQANYCSRTGRRLVILYCQDGVHTCAQKALDDCEDLKVLVKLITCFCRDIAVDIVDWGFSFKEKGADSAEKKLDLASIFYFKGFGGGVDELIDIFGRDTTPKMQQLVLQLQNRIMFDGCTRHDGYDDSHRKIPLLAIMVCGAAMLMGNHFPGHTEIQTLNLLGNAWVKYHGGESTCSLAVSNDPNVIQIAPGIATIISFELGRVQCSCVVAAKKHISDYKAFAAGSQLHLEQVLARHAFHWTYHYYYDQFKGCWFQWACRSDGLVHFFPDEWA